MLHIVPITPRYVFGVGTIVSTSVASELLLITAFDFELPVVLLFRRNAGEVNVAIWARRRTVSNGKRTASSNPVAAKLNKLQADGLRTGSMAK